MIAHQMENTYTMSKLAAVQRRKNYGGGMERGPNEGDAVSDQRYAYF